MSQTTYLDYTCAPNPLTEGATQDIVVIATLKSESELGVGITSATIDQIVLDFGTLGSGATQLTGTAFSVDNIETPPNWTAAVSGATCTLTPVSGHGEIATNAVIVKIKNVAVNNTSGHVTLAINEAATPAPQTSGEPPTTTPSTPGIENIILPKIASGQKEVSFSAEPANTAAGNGTTLSWSGGSSSDTYSLLYLKEGILQTITSHADGSLGADDAYPNTDLTPSDPGLTLNSTTTFILQIQKSGGEVINKTTTVVVSQPNIYAQTLQVSGTASTGPLTLNGAPGGKLGGGSRVIFGTSGDIASIEESWGLNLLGDEKHPVKSQAPFEAQDGLTITSGTTNTGLLNLNGAAGGKLGGGSRVEFTTGAGNVSIEEDYGLNLYGSSNQPVKIRNANLEVLEGRINVNQGMAVNGSVNLCQAPDYSAGTVAIGSATRFDDVMLSIVNNTERGYGINIDTPGINASKGFALMVNGQACNSNGSWFQISDINLKENVKSYDHGLQHVLKINPIKYNFKEETGLSGHGEHIGISAQDLQEVAPYMVEKTKRKPGSDEENLCVNNGPMTYMLINAVKELSTEIESLKKEVQALKSKSND